MQQQVDRLPILQARYAILRTCLEELIRVGIVGMLDDNMREGGFADFANLVGEKSSDSENNGDDTSTILLDCAKEAEGLSGRSLRRLPLQAHSQCSTLGSFGYCNVSVSIFLRALSCAIKTEQSARLKL